MRHPSTIQLDGQEVSEFACGDCINATLVTPAIAVVCNSLVLREPLGPWQWTALTLLTGGVARALRKGEHAVLRTDAPSAPANIMPRSTDHGTVMYATRPR